ncbi:MAG: beta-lactamase family protein [Pseudomonadales bacterium]|nr:beta-lactamase family protein [Pseudomonadales bacterium]
MLDGTVHPDFAEVAVTLARLIPREGAAGSAVCVYHRGRAVVDVWGGIRDRAGHPWQADTTAPSFSTTKGVLSTLVHILVDQGRAAYDDPVARYWPSFGARGKDGITIRQALCHEAGLYRIRDLIDDPAEMLDWQHMLDRIAGADPAHRPGEAHGYHALTYGWLIGGLIEGIAGGPLQRVLEEELVRPLGLDGMFIGMPRDQLHRRAELTRGVTGPAPDRSARRQRSSGRGADRAAVVLGWFGVRLDEFHAALNPFTRAFDWNAEATVRAIIPAANGQFTARSLARMYAMLAGGGELDGVRLLSAARVREIAEVRGRTRDRVLFIPMHWRMGYHRVFTLGRPVPGAFGHYGYGGSGAFCDPGRALAVALTLNSGAGTPMGNSSMPRVARAAIRCVDRLRG